MFEFFVLLLRKKWTRKRYWQHGTGRHLVVCVCLCGLNVIVVSMYVSFCKWCLSTTDWWMRRQCCVHAHQPISIFRSIFVQLHWMIFNCCLNDEHNVSERLSSADRFDSALINSDMLFFLLHSTIKINDSHCMESGIWKTRKNINVSISLASKSHNITINWQKNAPNVLEYEYMVVFVYRRTFDIVRGQLQDMDRQLENQ